MTVLGLAAKLIRGMLAGTFRPGDIVVREVDPGWDAGHGMFKEVLWAEPRTLPAHLDPHPDPAAINHTMFSRKGELGRFRLVRLD